jgi:hypothetical protein
MLVLPIVVEFILSTFQVFKSILHGRLTSRNTLCQRLKSQICFFGQSINVIV